MNDEILARHFAGESSSAEELEVQAYKAQQPDEYKMLQDLWRAKQVTVHEFDTAKAWERVASKAKRPKKRSLFPRWSAAAAVALLVLGGLYFSVNNWTQPTTEMLAHTATERNEKLTLDDGSVVYLNQGATVEYPAAFGNAERTMSLRGEAFFEIAKDANRPFSITTKHAQVEVLGTSFNINTQQAETEVAVATGKVKVQSRFEKESAVLTPNQSALVTAQELTQFDTEDENYLAWKTGNFVFKEMNIDEVVESLNRFYSDEIILENKQSDCVLTANLNKNELSEVMEIIQLTCNLEVTKNENSYELR